MTTNIDLDINKVKYFKKGREEGHTDVKFTRDDTSTAIQKMRQVPRYPREIGKILAMHQWPRHHQEHAQT